MNHTKLFAIKLLVILFAVHGVAEEAPLPAAPAEQPLVPTQVPTKSNFMLYANLSLAPTGGLSFRDRSELKGSAIDCSLGAAPLIIYDGWAPVISIDYNFIHYTKKTTTSPYFSYGIGVTNMIPHVPLRAGFEFEYGFIDIGGKLVAFFIPLPEIRGGLNVKF